jgi:hypothetical protein
MLLMVCISVWVFLCVVVLIIVILFIQLFCIVCYHASYVVLFCRL